MTEIYIERAQTRKGCRRVALGTLGLVALLVAAAMAWRRPRAHTHRLAPAPTPVPVVTAAPPAAASAAEDMRVLEAARQDMAADRLLDARQACYDLLERATDANVRQQAEDLLGQIHIALVMSPRPMPEKVEYTVQKGDTLASLAKKFGTTPELIARGNLVRGDLIRVGDRLRILQGRFSVAVDKSENTLVVLLNDRFFKRYRVGTGKYQKTPTGEFMITERVPQPTWWRPDGKAVPYGDPENVLGTHWLSLNLPGYGIHGTWQPETVGQHASEGCVRLLNEDIEELFTLLPVGTPVVITD